MKTTAIFKPIKTTASQTAFFVMVVFLFISIFGERVRAQDTTAPSIPTNLTATAVSPSQINLSWTASTDDVGVAGYNIYRCTGSSCTPTSLIGTSATNSYPDTELTAETTYTYRVSAYDAVPNTSGYSNSASATTMMSTGVTTMMSTGVVYISDHFDDQDDWVGYNGSCVDPPSPWASYGYYCSDRIHIDSTDDAHGSGKCMWIEWSQSMNELALMTYAAQGKNDYWAGFWWRHNAGWDWGGDHTHKWAYLPATNSNDRQMINYDGVNHRTIPPPGDHTYKSNVPFDTSDDSWHYVIYYLKHSTGTGNNDGQLRLWWDGTEVSWSDRYTAEPWDNLNIDYGTGSTWTSFMAFGFQSRPDWGSGNISYFDDIIVASTKETVEDFLGVGSADIQAPSNITNLSVSSCTSSSCLLTWTAPGDDNNIGTAASYDIRYSTVNITDLNWNSATQVTGESSPQAAGSSETHTVTGLTAETTYYFAIKTSDEVPNESGLSNVASGVTLAATGVNISGVSSDSVSHGDSVVVSGSGFGIHPDNNEGDFTWEGTTPICAKFKDFEDNLIESQGFHVENNYDAEWHIGTTLTRPNSNYHAVREHISNYLSMLRYGQSAKSTGTLFASFYHREANAHNTGKPFRWYFGDDSSRDNLYMASASWGAYSTHSESSSTSGDSFFTPTVDTWYRYDIIAEYQGVGVGTFEVYVDGVFKNSESDYFDSAVFDPAGHGVQWGAPSDNPIGTWDYDDIYVDYTQARVELGDNASWDSCTHKEIQIPTAWSDGSITININQGSFSVGETAYIFVVDENGDVSNGYPITIGSGGLDITPPIHSTPDNFTLQQNYPNPFNPSTIIEYTVAKPSNVQIKIYNQLGQEVCALVNELKPAGEYNVTWDGKDAKSNKLASGVYFYRLTAGKQVETKKMLYLR